MKKLIVVVFGLMVAVVAQAAKPKSYVLFPNADKSGDLASLAAWGAGYDAVPTNDWPQIDWQNPNATASRDITFSGLFLDRYNGNVTIDLTKTTPQPTITLTNDLYVNYFTTATLKGGTYDFRGTGKIARGDWGSGNGNRFINLILDECVMTNMQNITMGYAAANGSSYNSWTLKNGSAMYTPGFFRVEEYANNSISNTFSILSGSRLVVENGLMTDRPAQTPPFLVTGNRVVVSGTNSLLSVSGAETMIGQNFNESWLIVSNSAVANFAPAGKTASSVALGMKVGSNSNRLELVDHASLTGNEVKVGNGGTFGNRFHIGSQASLYLTQHLFVGHSSPDNYCRFDSGATAYVGTLYPGYSSEACGNVLEIADGASLTNVVIFMSYAGSHNNLIRVDGTNTEHVVRGKYYIGLSGGCSNKVAVTDGATLTVDTIYLNCGVDKTGQCSADNELLISNATVTVTNEFSTCTSDKSSYRGGTGAVIRLQGDAPHLYVTRSSKTSPDISNGTRFVYDLPAAGYAENVVPVQMLNWRTFDKTVRFEVTGVEAMQKDMAAKNERRRRIKLLQTTGNVLSGLCQDNVDASNAVAPEGARIYFEGVGSYKGVPHCSSVWVEVMREAGMTIIVR